MQSSILTVQSLRQLMKLTKRKEQLLKEVAKVETLIQGAISAGAPQPGKASTAKGRPKKAKRASKKAAKKASKPRGGRRGRLGKKILAALESAGPAGIKVADLAKSLGVKGANLHVWFSTTGKKHTKKVGRGHYRLAKS